VSLINQMLKDIDKRQGELAGMDAAPSVRAASMSAPTSRLKPLLGVLLIVVLLAVFHWRDRLPFVAGVAQKNTPQPQISLPAEPSPAAVAAPSPVAAPVPSSKDVSAFVATTVLPNTSLSLAGTKAAPQKTERQSSGSANKDSRPSQTGPVKKTQSGSQRSRVLTQEAAKLVQESRLQQAEGLLVESLQLDSNNHEARLLLARLQVRLDKTASARVLLNQGLKLAPEHHLMRMTLAHLELVGGNLDTAVQVLQAAESSARDNPDYQALLAALLQRQNRHQDAMSHYLAALRLSPENVNWLVGLGMSLEAQGLNTAAMESYERAIDIGGLSPNLDKTAKDRLAQLRTGRSRSTTSVR
jgi:MSHA biogenesis protein MshN